MKKLEHRIRLFFAKRKLVRLRRRYKKEPSSYTLLLVDYWRAIVIHHQEYGKRSVYQIFMEGATGCKL